MSSVRVAVRVRPLNKREKELASKSIVHMQGNTTSILKPSFVRGDKLKDRGKTFSFDFSYDSSDRESSKFASQQRIFQDLGCDVLKTAFEGFNACVFTYGQTGSGKSYTMMGLKDDKGLIPRICEGFFLEISNRGTSDAVSFHTEVSYLEIYNERVQDLLKKRAPSAEGGGLRVREHPRDGAYVENLSKHLVKNHSDMEDLIIFGNANRTTACTGMNDFSSRSHAIFTITFIQARFDADIPCETVSKIHLVDLAGSERAASTCTTGTRLKEGSNINKSLVILGSVISALADLSVGGQSAKKKQIFIPYRDSVLTWLLKDSLGGNARTTMIATISPADVNYAETLSTLRYASRAKNIVNTPIVNEDCSVKVIRELQAEVTRLRRLLEEATQVSHESSSSVTVMKRLHQNEAKVVAFTEKWTSKWGETESVLQEEEETVALRKEGSAVVLDCQLPHLISIDEDLLSTGITLYYLKEGRTLIGSCSCDIVLHGPGLLSEHCVLENHAGTVTLFPQEGALCSINGCLATDPCQLTRGAVIQLGTGTTLRFNHPTAASQLREKCQSGQPSLTDLSTSTENTSKVMLLHNPGTRSVEEKLNQQEVGLQQVSESQNRCNWGIKTIQNSGTPHQRRAERKSKVADGLFSQVQLLTADTYQCKGTTQAFVTTATPGRYPVPQSSFELDGGTLQGGVSTGDGQAQERDLFHKSGPGLISERPQKKTPSRDGAASYKAEEVWPGDASLQQTSVLGPGDGCGMKPEGNANEIQGVVTDCYKGRPGSGGNSLGSTSHLQSSRGSGSTSVLPQTRACSQLNRKTLGSQTPCCLAEETTFQGQLSGGGMDEAGGLKEIPGACVTENAEAPFQKSGLGSLFSRVSWFVQDAGRLLWRSPTVLQRVTEVRLQPIRARWSSQVVSLVRESNVLSVVKDSQVFSMVRGSFVFSLIDSHIFSMVKELPLIQHIQMEITQQLQPAEAAQMIQGCINPENAQLLVLTPTQTFSKAEELPDDVQLVPETIWRRTGGVQALQSPHKCNMADDVHMKQGQQLPLKHLDETKVSPGGQDQPSKQSVRSVIQTLIRFPDALLKLQTLPLFDMMEALQSIISPSVITSQKIVALHWLNVAKYTQPEPQPALLILMESALYTLTTDSGLLVLFHHLPLLQLKEIQIGLAGHSLRLMGASEESILGVYTHSQEHTKELCWAILGVLCPVNSGLYQHPLLCENLMKLSLDWQVSVPNLLLDAGLKVCSQFQNSLAELVYLLHCNMDQETVTLGEVEVLLYTSVAVCISPSTHREHVAQFLLTDTHFGVVKEDMVFYSTPRSTTAIPCRPQFHDLTLRQRSDVRCMLLHDEDKRGPVRLDVILANVKGMGHPETVAEAAGPSAHALNSSPHAEVWKLTFSCSTEAACLINHLSNV